VKKLTAIQKSAKGENCTLRIPGVCTGDQATVVLCHAPYPGRFGSRKHNWWAAYGCSACHDHIDHRDGYHPLTEFDWMPAIHETQTKLIEKGLMTVTA